jgi:hypothetical protein
VLHHARVREAEGRSQHREKTKVLVNKNVAHMCDREIHCIKC